MKSMYLLIALALAPVHAFAQAVEERCPELPPGSELIWSASEGPDFTYCRALRADGEQAFSVMLRPESSFRGTRSLREEEAVIDGHKVRWYRGEVALRPDTLVRETLVELDRRRTAHFMLRAGSEEQLARNMRAAESVRFRTANVGGD